MNAELTAGPTEETTLKAIYWRVSGHYAKAIEAAFESEDALQALQDRHIPGIPLDRTLHMNHILRQELHRMWLEHGLEVRSLPTEHDTREILTNLAFRLDYNLFTQVYLNLNPGPAIRYRSGDAEADISTLKSKWASRTPSPFDPKPKMFKVAATPEENEYNRDLSTIKALSIIGKTTPVTSFRVSPKGSTPTLVDSDNLSMLGVGADKYLQVPDGYTAWYFTWDAAPYILTARASTESGSNVFTPGIGYHFVSKSGDTSMLNTALFARSIAYSIFIQLPNARIALLPRMTSVLLLAPNELSNHVPSIHERLQLSYKGIEIHEGVRGERLA